RLDDDRGAAADGHAPDPDLPFRGHAPMLLSAWEPPVGPAARLPGLGLVEQVWVVALQHRPVLREYRLRDRYQLESRLDVPGALDAASGEGDGDVLLSLEVLVRHLGV